MKQRHLFVIDPFESLNFKLDSSLQMGMELYRRGHEVYVTELKHLSWEMQKGAAQAFVKLVSFPGETIDSVKVDKEFQVSLAAVTAIHMRKEPPVDDAFITATWLFDSVKDKVKIFNSPSALRSINEKMSIFMFKEFCQNALVSCSSKEILEYVCSQCDGDAIIKPLNMFGGKGIFRLNLASLDNAQALDLISQATQEDRVFRIVQAFDSSIYQGEIRAFALGGETLGWCLKRPAAGNFMANTSQGATLEVYKPNEETKLMLDKVNKQLLRHGVYVVGYDIIGGHISEINITSPRLLTPPEDKKNYYMDMALWFEEFCQ